MNKVIILIALFGLFLNPLAAQTDQDPRYHEFGIVFSSLNNFGLRYKYGSEKTMLRISVLSLNLHSLNTKGPDADSTSLKLNGYGLGLRIGFDHKIPLFGTFKLLLGAELLANYNYSHTHIDNSATSYTDETNSSIQPGVSFIFGVNYTLKEHLVLGAEINPTLFYSYETSIRTAPSESEYKQTTSQISFSLATQGAGLYIAYKFGK